LSTPFILPSFAAGELAPSMYGRVDLAKFHIGLATGRNVFVGFRGGVYSRAGTALCNYSKQTGRNVPPRTVAFQFSALQGLCLEFGNLYMRVFSNGQAVTESPTDISAITQANPGVVTDTGHGYSNGDWVYLSGIGGMTELNGRTLVVAGATTNTFTLTDVFDNAIDTTAYAAYTSGGTAARIYTLTTPYSEVDLRWLKFTESDDAVTICGWNQATGANYPPYALSRSADDSWTLTELTFGSVIAAPATCTGAASNIYGGSGSPNNKPTDYQYVATAVDFNTGQESQASPIANIPNSVDIALSAGSISLTCAPVTGAYYYNFYQAPPAYNGTVPDGSLFGYIGTNFGPSFVDTNIEADLSQVPPLHNDPFAPGQIFAIEVTNPGSGLESVTWTIGIGTAAGVGTGFEGYPIIVNQQLLGFFVTDNGTGYQVGNTITFDGAAFATGTLTFAAQPTAGDTIGLGVLPAVTWTFVATRGGSNQTVIQDNLADTLIQLATDLSNSAVPDIAAANYVATSGTVLTIQYGTAGIGGNSYTLATSSANVTLSGATLSGGSGSSGTAPSAVLSIGPLLGTYPSVPAYFQERLALMATPNQPDTYRFSQPGKFNNFDSRVPPVDSDAITGTPWAVEVNGIQWGIPMPGGLVVLTGLEAWQLTGAGGSAINPQPITPSSQQAQPQAYNGCSAIIAPLKIDADILYAQTQNQQWFDLAYQYWVNIYTGADLTFISPHLFANYQIWDRAWCQVPNRILWSVRNDGILLSLTYYKQQDVMGWTRHDTSGQVWSVASVTEPPVDALYLATSRFTYGGEAYFIERMDNRIWTASENTWCVDCALSSLSSFAYPDAILSVTAGGANGLGIPTGVTGLVGGSGYSAATAGSIVDPTGSGCVVNLTIVAGVITAVGFTGGTNYTYPQLVFNDPNGTGEGASATVTLNNGATFLASAAVFSGGDVGSAIRMGGGRAIITTVNSSTTVTATIVAPIVQVNPEGGMLPFPAQSGSWSMAPQSTSFGGLWHLEGLGVIGIADGIPVGPLTVQPDGTVTLPFAASYVTLGFGFTPQVQSLMTDFGQPTSQGRRKKISAISARLEASGADFIIAGANQPDGSAQSPPEVTIAWPGMTAEVQLPPNQGRPPYGSSVDPLFTGDVRVAVAGGFQKPGQVALQQTVPLPMNLLAFMPEILEGDEPQEQPVQEPGGVKRFSWGASQLLGRQRRAA
jgi:hypothetical protein